jgi:hypothetical protein
LYTRADWSKIYRYRPTEKKIAQVSDFKIANYANYREFTIYRFVIVV